MSVGKPALGSEVICFSKGAEHAIPPGEVPVIESMHIQLMMDGVMLGPLQDVSFDVSLLSAISKHHAASADVSR